MCLRHAISIFNLELEFGLIFNNNADDGEAFFVFFSILSAFCRFEQQWFQYHFSSFLMIYGPLADLAAMIQMWHLSGFSYFLQSYEIIYEQSGIFEHKFDFCAL